MPWFQGNKTRSRPRQRNTGGPTRPPARVRIRTGAFKTAAFNTARGRRLSAGGDVGTVIGHDTGDGVRVRWDRGDRGWYRKNQLQSVAQSASRAKNPDLRRADLSRPLADLGRLVEVEVLAHGHKRRWAISGGARLASAGGDLVIVKAPNSGMPRASGDAAAAREYAAFHWGRSGRGQTARAVAADPSLRSSELGELREIVYETAKGADGKIEYAHAFGAPYPRLLANPTGLLIWGGVYKIESRGIVG